MVFARLGVFGDPFDLVVSGINPGANAGRAIYHSGTVGAALTARNGGVSGVAISQAVVGFGVEGQGWDDMLVDQHWETAGQVGAEVAVALLRSPPPSPIVVNVNVPNLALSDVRGWRRVEVASAPPRALASASLVPMVGHDGAFSVEMQWGDPVTLSQDTDSGAVEHGFVAISALSRLVDDPSTDLGVVDDAIAQLLS